MMRGGQGINEAADWRGRNKSFEVLSEEAVVAHNRECLSTIGVGADAVWQEARAD